MPITQLQQMITKYAAGFISSHQRSHRLTKFTCQHQNQESRMWRVCLFAFLYLVRVDADDWSFPSKYDAIDGLECLLRYMSRTRKDLNLDGVFGVRMGEGSATQADTRLPRARFYHRRAEISSNVNGTPIFARIDESNTRSARRRRIDIVRRRAIARQIGRRLLQELSTGFERSVAISKIPLSNSKTRRPSNRIRQKNENKGRRDV